MTIEIKPEVKAAIDKRLRNGAFHDIDELLTKALEALPENNAPALAPPRPNLADFLLNSPLAGAELNLERRKEYPQPPIDI